MPRSHTFSLAASLLVVFPAYCIAPARAEARADFEHRLWDPTYVVRVVPTRVNSAYSLPLVRGLTRPDPTRVRRLRARVGG